MKIRINNSRIRFFSLVLALVLVSIMITYDVFSFYPLRVRLGLQISAPISLKPAITQEQFDGLVWLRNQTAPTDLVVVHIQLWSYATFLLRDIYLTSYARSAPQYGEPARSYWEQAFNLVIGSPEAFRFLGGRWEKAFIVLTKNYDGQTDASIKKLREDWRYELIFENQALVIFKTNLRLRLSTLPSIEVINNWYTRQKNDSFIVEYSLAIDIPALIWNINSSVSGWRTVNFLTGNGADLSNYSAIILAINSTQSEQVMEFRLYSDNSSANMIGWRFNIDFSSWHFIELPFNSTTEDLVNGNFDIKDVTQLTFGFALKTTETPNIEFRIAIIVIHNK